MLQRRLLTDTSLLLFPTGMVTDWQMFEIFRT